MEQNAIVCSSCGAPGTIKDGDSKWACQHCGRETVLESKFVQNLSEKVSSSFQEVGNQTQVELQHLQYSQELSMLQMQLSNLNAEKRSLERENSRASYVHLGQVMAEESRLKDRIAVLQNKLPAVPPSINTQYIAGPTLLTDMDESNKSWGTTLFLSIFFGMFGGHRYYTGRIGSAIAQTFTVGGFYIWWIIDIISILRGTFKDSQGRLLNRNIKTNRTLMKIVGGFWIWFVGISIIMQNTTTESQQSGQYALSFFGLIIVIVIVLNIRFVINLIKKLTTKNSSS